MYTAQCGHLAIGNVCSASPQTEPWDIYHKQNQRIAQINLTVYIYKCAFLHSLRKKLLLISKYFIINISVLFSHLLSLSNTRQAFTATSSPQDIGIDQGRIIGSDVR